MNLPPGLVLCAPDGAVLRIHSTTQRQLGAARVLGAAAETGGESCLVPLREALAGKMPDIACRGLTAAGLYFDVLPLSHAAEPCLLVRVADEANGKREPAATEDALRGAALRLLYEGLVHALRSPLNAITMNAEMLRFTHDAAAGPVREQREKRYVAAVLSEIQRLDRAVNTLVELLGGEQGDPLGGVDELVEVVERLCAPALRIYQVDLRVEGAPHSSGPGNYPPSIVAASIILTMAMAASARTGDAVVIESSADALAVRLERHASHGHTIDDSPNTDLAGSLLMAVAAISSSGGQVDFGRSERVVVNLPRP
jgi:signal transduction histidine kinase